MTSFSLPLIETERLRLRVPQIADYDGFADFLASPRAAYIGGPFSDPMAIARAFGNAAGMWMLRGFGTFIFERKSDGCAIGHGGPWQPIHWPEPELGWCIWRDEDEGKGYVAEALTELRAWAFKTLGWKSCVSYIDAKNHRSAAVARRLGATRDLAASLPLDWDPSDVHVYRHAGGGA